MQLRPRFCIYADVFRISEYQDGRECPVHELHWKLELVNELNWIDAKNDLTAHAVAGAPHFGNDEVHRLSGTCKRVTAQHDTVAQMRRHDYAGIELRRVDRMIDDDRKARAFGQKEARRR